jgi:hypothetical protein
VRDAFRVQMSFAPIMLATIALPGGGLFEADVTRGDEIHERRRRMGGNAVGLFAVSVVDGFHAERPNYRHVGVVVWRERIRRRDHAVATRCRGLRETASPRRRFSSVEQRPHGCKRTTTGFCR